MRTPLLSFLLVAILPSAVAAAPALKLDCTSQGKPLAKKGRVPGAIDCALTVKKYDGNAESLKATLKATWGGGKKSGTVADGTISVEGNDVFFQFALQPGDGFPACEKFDLVAEVTEDGKPLGKKKLGVAAECPKPKPIKASLLCSFEAADGTMFKYPGNGSKTKPRLERELTCYISVPKPPAGAALKGTIKLGKKTREAEAREVPTGGIEAVATFYPDDDFVACESATAEGELTIDGQSVWKGSLPVPQSCPD
ncbi:MAG TPA: hypothetical protein VGK67_26770 [Myxococcales bacterium]|jgi:hypothetical protein